MFWNKSRKIEEAELKLEEEREEAEKERERIRQIAELKAFRPIGGRFDFLGIILVVFAHSDNECEGVEQPLLCCNYINKNGTIKEAYFSHSELPLLRAENP